MSTAVARYARATPGYEERVGAAAARLRSAAIRHAGRVVQATSLGAEDMVITDLIARQRLPIALATLDTGHLHAQTLDLVARLQTHYGLEVERHRPQPQRVIEFVARYGDRAMYRSIELRKACCGVRKLEPLARLLAGRSAWVTGLRREQSDARAEVPFDEPDGGGRVKFNPLADWSWADVWQYIGDRAVPYNPLHDGFFPSIGCAPCTRAIALGEPFRAGRWWWEQDDLRECGLHLRQEEQEGRDCPEAAA
jgi:phosphoadenosine phosphosulfate reductase